MFRALLATLLSLALTCCSATNCMGGSIVYNIQNYADLQNGYTVSGTITTDGTIGTLTLPGAITAWSFSVTGPESYQATSQDPGAETLVVNLTASASELTMTLPPTNGYNQFDLFGPSIVLAYERTPEEGGFPGSDFYGAMSPGVADLWGTFTPYPPGLSLGGSPWIIATAATIPEPGTLTLALLGGACIGAVQWMRRCRRAVSRSDR
jgi:hypothetical protein